MEKSRKLITEIVEKFNSIRALLVPIVKMIENWIGKQNLSNVEKISTA